MHLMFIKFRLQLFVLLSCLNGLFVVNLSRKTQILCGLNYLATYLNIEKLLCPYRMQEIRDIHLETLAQRARLFKFKRYNYQISSSNIQTTNTIRESLLYHLNKLKIRSTKYHTSCYLGRCREEIYVLFLFVKTIIVFPFEDTK